MIASYLLIQKIENPSCPLDHLLNRFLDEMFILKSLSNPGDYIQNLENRVEGYYAKQIKSFYDVCLFECFSCNLSDKLKEWKSQIEIYRDLYQFEWEFYSRAKISEFENEFGHSESEYESEEAKMMDFSIICDLKGYRHELCLDLKMDNIIRLLNYTTALSGLDVFTSFAQAMKIPIKLCTIDAEGNAVPKSILDHQIELLEKESQISSLSELLIAVVTKTRALHTFLSNLPKNKNNKEELTEALDTIDRLLQLKIN